jgi:arabinogalactan oligomer/maltooligosaccharide transport system substrate-binding protein
MYRLIGLLLTSFLLCSADFLYSASPSIRIWHAYRGEEKDLLEEIVHQVEQDLKVQITLLSLPYQVFSNKLQASIPKGNGPDLWIFAHDRIGDWVEDELIEPIGYWIKQDDLESTLASSVSAMTDHGNLYGLPISYKTLVLYYNHQLVPNAPQTMHELMEIAQQPRFREAKPNQIQGLGIPEADSLYFHAPWLHAFHGSSLDFINLPVEQSIKPMQESALYLKSLLSIMPKEMNSALVTELFKREELLFVVNGPWFKGDLIGFDHWAITPLPRVSQTDEQSNAEQSNPLNASPFLTVEGLFLSAYSHQKEIAFQVMKAMTSQKYQQMRIDRGVLVVDQSVQPKNEKMVNWFKIFQSAAQTAIPMPTHPKMKAVWTPVKKYLSQVIDGSNQDPILLLKKEISEQVLQKSSFPLLENLK